MSGLIKAFKNGVKKVFKAVKKVVKKITSNKIFKAVAIAAAVVFTGGAALGALGATSMGAGLAASGMAATSAVGSTLGAVGSIAGAIGSAGGAVGSVLGTVAGGVGTWAAANPMLASTALQVGSQVIGGYSQNKAERDAWEDDREELRRNNSTVLNIRDRLQADTNARRSVTSNQPTYGQPTPQVQNRSQSVASRYSNPVNEELNGNPRSFYDPTEDMYRTV